jgi:hypothetical protein
MNCYDCGQEASAKIGSAKGNIWRALFGKTAWEKGETYHCRHCYDIRMAQKHV